MNRRSACWCAALYVMFVVTEGCLPSALANPVRTSANYTLEARLPDDGSVSWVRGAGRIELTNGSVRALNELAFHLYMNAYKPSSIAFNSLVQDGRAAVRGGGPAKIEVHSLRDLRKNVDLVLKLPPVDADQTTAVALLPEAIEPGETISLAIEWTTWFPHLVQRTGHVGDYLFAGQWFPKLAKLEASGTFAQFSFYPQAEFYSDFGTYDVTIDAPDRFVLAAAGVETETTHDRGRQRRRFVAHRVHDYAWSAWPDYQVERVSIGDIAVRLFTPPGHEANRTATLSTLRRAAPFFQTWLGDYPYETLTVVHPPEFAANAGGMEYPTLITTGGPWYAAYSSSDIERVTLHEFAHQWFYGLLASNEHAWPFLDEGLTTFAENRALEALLDAPLERLRQSASRATQRQRALGLGKDFPIAAPAPEFPSFSHLAALAYERAALVFDTLSRVYGERFGRALQAYTAEHRFNHPTPEHLLTSIGEHVNASAAQTTRQALFGRGWVNYKLSSLTHSYTAAPGRATGIRPPSDGQGITSRLLVTRQGSLSFPVQIEFYDANGQRSVRQWDGQSSTWEHVHVGDVPLVRACVDAKRTVTLDEQYADNCFSKEPERRPWLRALLANLMQLLLLATAW